MMKRPVSLITILILFCSIAFPSFARTVRTSPVSCQATSDFTTYIGNQLDAQLNLANSSPANASTVMNLYTSRPYTFTDPAVRNPNAWTNSGTPIDFTGVAGLDNSDYGNMAQFRGATLISPRYFMEALHFPMSVGSKVVFYDAQGNPVVRTVVDYRYIGCNSAGVCPAGNIDLNTGDNIGYTDIAIGKLDSDVPDSIAYYPVISDANFERLIEKVTTGSNLDVPIVILNQFQQAIVQQLTSLDDQIQHAPYASNYPGPRSNFSIPLIAHDSGQPGFIIIDGQPVLLFAHYGANNGPNYGEYIDQINAAMISMGGEYQLTQYNPGCFTLYPVNHPPLWTTVPQQQLFVYEQPKPSVLFTFAAQDRDPGQTVTYSLASLTSQSSSAKLNPNNYFAIDPKSGALTQIANMSVSQLGNLLTLGVSATSSAQFPVTITTSATIQLRKIFNQPPQVILDPAFNAPLVSDGVNPNGGQVVTLAYDQNNKLLIAGGFASVGGVKQGSIARLNTDGSVDASFAHNIGSGATYQGGLASINKITIDGNNNILIGSFNQDTFNGTSTGLLTRLTGDGVLDLGFLANEGSGATSTTSFGINDIAFINDQKNNYSRLLAAGANTFNSTPTNSLMAITGQGAWDSVFNNNIGAVGSSIFVRPVAAVDAAWNIYLGGQDIAFLEPSGVVSRKHIVKFNENGVIDTSFDVNIGTGFDGAVNALSVRPDGKIVVVGAFTHFNNIPVGRIALLGADGTLDTSFTTNIGSGFNGAVYAIDVQSDNRSIIGGIFNSFNNVFTNALVRLNADGTLDTSFQNAVQYGVTDNIYRFAVRKDGALAVIGNGLLNDYNGTVLGRIAVLETAPPPAPSINVPGPVVNSQLTLSGTALPNAVINLYDGTVLIGTTTADGAGNWSFQKTMLPGAYQVTATQQITFTSTATSSVSQAVSVNVPGYSLTTNVSGNGQINVGASNSISALYTSGQTVTLSAVPASGYQFSSWSGDIQNTTNPTVVTMDSNKSIMATFVPMVIYYSSSTGRYMSDTGRNISTYNITASAGFGGRISTPGSASVKNNASQIYTITPNSGYKIASVIVNGIALANAPSSYIFSNVTASQTIRATFVSTYTITLAPNQDYWFSSNSPLTLADLQSAGMTASNSNLTPVEEVLTWNHNGPPSSRESAEVIYYRIQGVWLQLGTLTPLTSPGSISISNYFIIRTGGVLLDKSLQFANNVAFYGSTVQNPSVRPWDHSITAQVFGNGSITPAGTSSVQMHGSQVYTWAADPGAQLIGVTVNGVALTGVLPMSYTFSNVTANQSIKVMFGTVPKKIIINGF